MPESFELSPEAWVDFEPGAPSDDRVTLWSGAQAFRVRPRRDLAGTEWTVTGRVGTTDDDVDNDALRFDPASRALRELHLNRPRRVHVDDALIARVTSTAPERGELSLPVEVTAFSLRPVDAALFDVTLGVYAGLREVSLDALTRAPRSLRAIAVSPHAALLFLDGAYVGWRVVDPALHARPMGWPEARSARALDASARGSLTSLLYDWMTLDASPRVEPAEAPDTDDIAHLVALRDRARALAGAGGDDHDAAAGVARDIAAHVHWSWGFFRVGEGIDSPGGRIAVDTPLI